MLQGLVILLKKLITSHLPYNIVELIDGTGGVIIMSNKNMSAEKSYNLIKKRMLKEIQNNDNFNKVFDTGNLPHKTSQ